ncbi:MAG: 16S rRNA (uracil(1498)-N(3))-methyltransferase [Endomicrobium sp.]|nr:16S rRNA (uracil(1498)-N(3))-methyltransferase [Endomicrobium sp.]
MPHFYVEPKNIINSGFKIEGAQAHYVLTVKRFNAGDEIMIFDGLGNSYKGKILTADKNFIAGIILSSSYKKPSFEINLYTAVPKGERFEWLIEKAAEIGVVKIVPLITKRSAQTDFSENKLARFEKISISASGQCGRNDIMKIYKPQDFKTACQNASENKNFITVLAWESSDLSKTLPFIFEGIKPFGANIFIGPEGGFEDCEVAFAKELGVKTVSLGENILRIETAAIAAVILTSALLCKNTI